MPTPPLLDAKERDAKENRDIAAISYVWALGVFVFLWKKDSPFVRFHAKQGIVLFILTLLFWYVPYVGRFFELLILALCVLGFFNAAQGQWKELPLIGDMATGHWSHVRQSFRDIGSMFGSLWHRIRPVKESKPAPVEPVTPVAPPTPAVVETSAVPVQPVSSIMQTPPTETPSASSLQSDESSPNPNPNPTPTL